MSIKIKNGSSMYKLATWWDTEQMPKNFCSLFWTVVIRIGFISLGCTAAGTVLGFLLASIAASISVGYIIWTASIAVVTALIVVIALIFMAAATYCLIENTIEEEPEGKLSNIATIYSGWKNKYCPTVEEIE